MNKARSIPAYAGEPVLGAVIGWMLWVDPRVCGGAIDKIIRLMPCKGRSPRMRGSLNPQHYKYIV